MEKLKSLKPVFGGLALLVLVYLIYLSFRPQPVPVDLATIERGPLAVTVGDEGRTRVREVYVVSAPVGGKVERIAAKAGDSVIKDDTVLASIRPSAPRFLNRRDERRAQAEAKAARAALALAEAALARSKAALDFAETELIRARKLTAKKAASKQKLDEAELKYKTAGAEMASARAEMDMRRYELETAEAALIQPTEQETGIQTDGCCVAVHAPIVGRVLKVLQESEAVVGAGAPLVELGDPTDLEIVVDLLSEDAVKVAGGAEAIIENWGGPGQLAGRVRTVEPYGFTKISALGVEEQRVNVIIDLTAPRQDWDRLGHGYRVDAKVTIWKEEDVLQAPLSALFRTGETWSAFVMRDGKAVSVPVELGQRNHRKAQVLKGLNEGDKVILHPSDKISDGSVVIERP